MLKKIFLPTVLICLMLGLLLFPNLCINAAQSGLLLWFNKVVPSLLPFIILINIFIRLQGIDQISKLITPLSHFLWQLPGYSLFAFLIGLVAGYPMGAKVIKQLVDSEKLSSSEAEKTLCFCNNCGPLFIVGTVGTAMINDVSLGYFLLFVHILSAFLMSLLQRSVSTTSITTTRNKQTSTSIKFTQIFNESVINAMDTIVCIGGYIIFFSVITRLLISHSMINYLSTIPLFNLASKSQLIGLFTGFFEISNGAYSLTSITPLSISTISLLAAILSFGGCCVYFQTLYVLEGFKISAKRYFLFKCLQSILTFTLSGILYPLYTRETFSQFQGNCFILFIVILLIYYIYLYYHKKTYPYPVQ